ncbi:unnamed protein product [Laminaria digitata]
MAAVGCMATRSEIEREISIAGPQTGVAVAARLPELLRAHRRALPGSSPDPVSVPSSAMVESSGQLHDSDESKQIAKNATDNSAKTNRATPGTIVGRSGVGDVGGGVGVGVGVGVGGEGLYGNGAGGMFAGDAVGGADTIGSGVRKGEGLGDVTSSVREGKGAVVAGEGSEGSGNSLGVTDEAASMTSSGNDYDRSGSSAMGEGINREGVGEGGGEAGRSHDGMVDAAIPNRDPASSGQENSDATGGRNSSVNHLTPQARENGLPLGSERGGGTAVSDIAGMPDAGGSNTAANTGNTPAEVIRNRERTGGSAANAPAAAAAAAAARAAAAAGGAAAAAGYSETVGDRSAAGQRDGAVGGMESAQAKSDPPSLTQQAERAARAERPTTVPAAPPARTEPAAAAAEHTTLDSAAREEPLAAASGSNEEEEKVKTPGATETDPFDEDGAAVVRLEGGASTGNADGSERQAEEKNASTPRAGKPPAKSTWGWGLPAWAGGGKNNGAR